MTALRYRTPPRHWVATHLLKQRRQAGQLRVLLGATRPGVWPAALAGALLVAFALLLHRRHRTQGARERRPPGSLHVHLGSPSPRKAGSARRLYERRDEKRGTRVRLLRASRVFGRRVLVQSPALAPMSRFQHRRLGARRASGVGRGRRRATQRRATGGRRLQHRPQRALGQAGAHCTAEHGMGTASGRRCHIAWCIFRRRRRFGNE